MNQDQFRRSLLFIRSLRALKLWFFVLFALLGCGRNEKKETKATVCQKPYFIKVPIVKFSSIGSPCLEVFVENKAFTAELDLGFRGNLALRKEFSDTLGSKSLVREKTMYGIRGKEYLTKVYQIPKLRIGKMTFYDPLMQEEGADFIKDATFVKEGQKRSIRDPGRIGWELFYNVNLLVDASRSYIAFCDSITTLQNQGYEVEKFTRTPLLLERGLVELEADTSSGKIRCALDTGATWNILDEAVEDKSIDELLWDPKSVEVCPLLKVGERNLGPIAFHKLPIKIPIRIEAILGMDFFRKYVVFLDFRHGYVYFSKIS